MNSSLIPSLLLITGFALMIVGADRLIKGAIELALKLNLSKVFIGAVLVGFGTSAPELFTSLYSASQGEGILAAGNVIGSNIFNSTLVMAVCLLFPFALSKSERGLQNIVLVLLPALLILIFGSDLKFSSFEGVLLLIPLPIFLWIMAKQGSGEDEVEENDDCNLVLSIFWVVLGAFALYYGSSISIKGSLALVDIWGLSKGFAGAVILAAGTGLPELVTTVVAGFKKEMSLAFANIVGSNALNVFGVLGISSLLFPFEVSKSMALVNAPILMGVSLIGLLPLMFIGNKIFLKTWSILLFATYFAFSFNAF